MRCSGLGLLLWGTIVAAHSPHIRYEFTGESCHQGRFDSVGSPYGSPLTLVGNETTCSEGNLGVEVRTGTFGNTETSPMIGSLEPLYGSPVDGISFSFWLRSFHETNNDESLPIISISSFDTDSTVSDFRTECDRQNVDFQLLLRKGTLELLYRTSDSYFEPCQRISWSQAVIPLDELVHVTVVLTHMRQQIFVNGEPVGEPQQEPFDPTLSHWKRPSQMSFFQHASSFPWYGALYQFEVYNRSLDTQNVRTVLSRGMAHSLPVVRNSTLYLHEDAELTPESHETRWYEDENSFHAYSNGTYPSFDLSISFLDEQVDELLTGLGINHTAPPTVHYYITQLPENGHLYQLDGTNMSAVPGVDLVELDPDFDLVFVPFHNAHSSSPDDVFATIYFCVSVASIFLPSQCVSSAQVDVVVESVNDPPVAQLQSILPYYVREGIVEEEDGVHLGGYDVDEGDAIFSIEISKPPQLGFLYLSVPIRRTDGIPHGTPLTELNDTILGEEAVVEYRHSDSGRIVRGSSLVDSFEFRVRDSHGSLSDPVSVNIVILSSVTAQSTSEAVQLSMGRNMSVPLHGEDESGWNRSVAYYLESVPPPDIGDFRLADKTVHVDTILPGEQVPRLEFEPHSEACNGDVASLETTFSYRTIAYGEDGFVASVSNKTHQEISLACPSIPMTLSMQQSTIEVQAFEGSLDSPCSGYMFNENGFNVANCSDAVLLGNVYVGNTNGDTENVVVTISSGSGKLTVRRPQRNDTSYFQLEDHGIMRRTVRFMARPKDLEEFMSNNIHFQSAVLGLDKITISIQREDCSANKNDCVLAESTIQVEVLPPDEEDEKETMFTHFPWIPPPFTLALVLLMKATGKSRVLLTFKDEPEEDEEEQTEEETKEEPKETKETTTVFWHEVYDEEQAMCFYEHQETMEVTWDPPAKVEFKRIDGSIGVGNSKSRIVESLY
eukprot:Nitzschia sp. Nitz4//scaffold141_size107518//68940//71783//NITZ4_004285-RA/size107518-processed-gene-0.136-mRNA-1//-1//CDS//3329536315//851//frame0